MTITISTTIKNIDTISSFANQNLIKEFYNFMESSGTSERYQNNNLKPINNFAKFIDPHLSLINIDKKDIILQFLDTKIKSSEDDPDKK